MNKPPAFQFYANDWLSSTQITLMSPAEEGAYIRLLAISWNDKNCCLPDDDEILAKLSRLDEEWHSHSGAIIKKCFKKKGNKIFNERLLKEKRKIEQFRKERSKSGKLGAEKRWHLRTLKKKKKKTKNNTANGSAIAQPMAKNGSSSSSSNNNIIYVEQSKKLGELILKRKPDYKNVLKEQKRNWVNWTNDFRLIAEADKRIEEITDMLIELCQQHPFWQKNICSPGKLRKQYDRLMDEFAKEIDQRLRKKQEKEATRKEQEQWEKEYKKLKEMKLPTKEQREKVHKMIEKALKPKKDGKI